MGRHLPQAQPTPRRDAKVASHGELEPWRGQGQGTQGTGAGQDLPFILQATPWTGSATGPAGSQVASAQLPTTGPGEANHLTKQDGTAADDRRLPTVQGRKCWKRLDEMWEWRRSRS
jgi:hypothetical protein